MSRVMQPNHPKKLPRAGRDLDALQGHWLLARLGKHRRGKGCLYLKRLGDVDLEVLQALIAASAAERQRRYPD